MPQQRGYTFDAATQLSDSAAIVASANAQVGGVDRILDLGQGRIDGVAVIDVAALDNTSADEKYELELQFSSSPTFAAGVVVGPTLKLGTTAAIPSNSAASSIGRYELKFCNEFAGVILRYMRLYRRLGGTTPSITSTAYVAQE